MNSLYVIRYLMMIKSFTACFNSFDTDCFRLTAACYSMIRNMEVFNCDLLKSLWERKKSNLFYYTMFSLL